ncbi:hypothetical protein M514_02667 [Trichuris suis]|uniref:Uncharacterized protein n=1 Tax=Trichuris suis TaxID=68888 RepID=A0A085MQ39_9BILA|nr:hypothetical protein M513_02667 [Trichuris suis]KFD59335.1 hypothetical protein M514_02667 [Trichuris suis]
MQMTLIIGQKMRMAVVIKRTMMIMTAMMTTTTDYKDMMRSMLATHMSKYISPSVVTPVSSVEGACHAARQRDAMICFPSSSYMLKQFEMSLEDVGWAGV